MVDLPRAAACVLIRNPKGKILGVSRKDNVTAFGIPGGKLETGETYKECAARELFEETGIKVKEEQLTEVLRCICEGEIDYYTVTFQVAYSDQMENRIETSAEETGLVSWVDWQILFDGPFGSYNRQLESIVGN